MYKNSLTNVAMVIVSIFSIALAVSSFSHLKKMEFEFNERKALLVKENLDLKDRLGSIQELVTQKTEFVSIVESEKKTLENTLAKLRDENDTLMKSYSKQLEMAKMKNAILRKKISSLEHSPVVQRIKEAMQEETNANIKKVLENTLTRIELIKEGKSITLEPIVVTKKTAVPIPGQMESPVPVLLPVDEAQGVTPPAPEKQGIVLSVDKPNALVVISLGRRDDIKEGDLCRILKDDEEIARAEIMGLRYRIAAAFANDFNHKYTINDVKENYKVVMIEK